MAVDTSHRRLSVVPSSSSAATAPPSCVCPVCGVDWPEGRAKKMATFIGMLRVELDDMGAGQLVFDFGSGSEVVGSLRKQFGKL